MFFIHCFYLFQCLVMSMYNLIHGINCRIRVFAEPLIDGLHLFFPYILDPQVLTFFLFKPMSKVKTFTIFSVIFGWILLG